MNNLKTCLAIDIGGTNTKVAVIDEMGKFLFEKMFPTQEYTDFTQFAQILNLEIQAAIKQFNIIGVGIGCPNYNNQNEAIENAPNLPWGNVFIKKIIQSATIIPVKVGKDAPLAALGEYRFTPHQKYNDLAVITIGTGIGSGIIIHGELHQTVHGYGSEAGHLVVSDKKRPCGCGGFDHLESFSSVTALRARATLKYHEKVSFTELKNKYQLQDPIALEIIDEAAYHLAIGITQIVNLVGSRKVILAGGGISLGENFLKLIRNYYQQLCFNTHRNIEIDFSQLPINHGALLGAASLVFF